MPRRHCANWTMPIGSIGQFPTATELPLSANWRRKDASERKVLPGMGVCERKSAGRKEKSPAGLNCGLIFPIFFLTGSKCENGRRNLSNCFQIITDIRVLKSRISPACLRPDNFPFNFPTPSSNIVPMPIQQSVQARNKLIVALDFPGAADAVKAAHKLRGHAGAFKVGSELFSVSGPSVV